MQICCTTAFVKISKYDIIIVFTRKEKHDKLFKIYIKSTSCRLQRTLTPNMDLKIAQFQ